MNYYFNDSLSFLVLSNGKNNKKWAGKRMKHINILLDQGIFLLLLKILYTLSKLENQYFFLVYEKYYIQVNVDTFCYTLKKTVGSGTIRDNSVEMSMNFFYQWTIFIRLWKVFHRFIIDRSSIFLYEYHSLWYSTSIHIYRRLILNNN